MSDEENIPQEPEAEKGQGAGEAAKSFIGRIGEALDTTAKVARLSLDIGALNSRRTALFQDMGRKVYDLYGKGLVKNAALAALAADAAAIDAEIAEKRAQIAELRGERGGVESEEQGEELGIEEDAEAAAAPTSSGDLTSDEEKEARPPRDKKL